MARQLACDAVFYRLNGASALAALFQIAEHGGGIIVAENSSGGLELRQSDTAPYLTPSEQALLTAAFGEHDVYDGKRPIELRAVHATALKEAIKYGFKHPARFWHPLLVIGAALALPAIGAFLAYSYDQQGSQGDGRAIMVLFVALAFVPALALRRRYRPTQKAQTFRETLDVELPPLVRSVRACDVEGMRNWFSRESRRPQWWHAAWDHETPDALAKLTTNARRTARSVPKPRPRNTPSSP